MLATAKDLRFHSKELLDVVAMGEEVTITYRGEPRAKLIRFVAEKEISAENELFGLWRNRSLDVTSQVRKLREGRKLC